MSGPAISIVMGVVSAVSAIKALKEGNILGAVMGGFGAYMGLAGGMGAFEAATLGDVNALTAVSDVGGTSFAQLGGALQAGTPIMGTELAPMASMGTGSMAIGEALGNIGALEPTSLDLLGTGQTVTPDVTVAAPDATVGKGVLSDAFGGVKDLIEGGYNKVVGALEDLGDGTFLDTGTGNIFDGSTGQLLQLGKMAVGGFMQKSAQDDKIAAAEEARAAAQQAAAEKRKRVGAAPTVTYGFGGRSVKPNVVSTREGNRFNTQVLPQGVLSGTGGSRHA